MTDALSPLTMRRNLGDARRAYGLAEQQNEDVARQLSQAAHSIVSSQPKGALADAGWTEGGHNEETTHLGAKLMLRGGVEGLMASLSMLALAHGAGWPSTFSVPVSLVLTGCWAVCAACREGLDSVTYSAHYARERSREAWGEALRSALPPTHPPPQHHPRALVLVPLRHPRPDASVRLAPLQTPTPPISPTSPRFPLAHRRRPPLLLQKLRPPPRPPPPRSRS